MFASTTKRRSWRARRLADLAWCGATLIAAGVALAFGVSPVAAGVGALACMTPPFLALCLSRRLAHEWSQAALTSAWTALALGAAFVLGAVSGAASWFLIPVLVAFTLGRRSLILETGVSSLLALGLAAALEAGGLAPPLFPAGEHKLLSALAAGMTLVMAVATAAEARRQAMRERAAMRRQTAGRDALDDLMPAAMLRLNREGRVAAASGAVEAILGRDRAALIGAPAETLADADEESAAALNAALAQTFCRPGELATAQVATADGARLELRARGLADGVALLALDMTERLDRERALAGERDAAILASEAKSRFLASMSHEIRTPLNAIIGFSDVMKQRMFGPVPARYAEYADLIHESGLHLLDLVGDVLDMSKIEADRYELKLEPMDARDVASAATRLMRLRAEEAGVRLTLDCGLGPLPARADRKALRQILLNLLSNAVKFTPRGGEVSLSLRSEAGDLLLEVADTGPGMTAAEIRRIGEPYRQAASADGAAERGSGLGLSLVASLAALHGGGLEIESTPGEGATVRVRLPVLETAGAPVRMDARARLQRAAQAGEVIARVQAEG